MHGSAFVWLKKAKAKEFEALVASHSLAETYAVLTSMPLRPRISPPLAARLLRENVTSLARIVSLSVSDYRKVVNEMSELGLSGGVIYDALIARAAAKAATDRLLTLNPSDFVRVWPEGSSRISSP